MVTIVGTGSALAVTATAASAAARMPRHRYRMGRATASVLAHIARGGACRQDGARGLNAKLDRGAGAGIRRNCQIVAPRRSRQQVPGRDVLDRNPVGGDRLDVEMHVPAVLDLKRDPAGLAFDDLGDSR